MMQAAALNQSASADAPAEVSATPTSGKTSFWSRVKNAAITTAKRIAKPFTFVASKTAPAAKKAAKAVKNVATKVASKVSAAAKAVSAKARPTTTKVVSWSKATWKRVLKPFLKVRVLAMAIITVAVGLLLAPFATVAIAVGTGATLYALSFGIEALEESDSKAAHFALRAVEIVITLIKGAAYVAAAALTIAFCAFSLPFALTEVLELVLRYLDVADAGHIASAVFFTLVGSWWWLGLTLLLIARRRVSTQESLRRPIVQQQPVVHAHGNRRVKLPACTACGEDDAGARYALRGRGGLCGACFEDLSREDSLEAARKGQLTKREYTQAVESGMTRDADIERAIEDSMKRRYTALMADEVDALPQRKASTSDTSKVHWAEVAWWHDNDGKPHTRKWLGFVAGSVVAAVEYNHRAADNRFRASLFAKLDRDGKKLGGYRSLAKAREVIGDALSDEAAIVGGMLDGLREEAEAKADEPKAVSVSPLLLVDGVEP